MVARETRTADLLRAELCGIPLKNPLMPAAGTLAKEALEGVRGVYGAVVPKTVTPRPRAGNPPPRIAEAAAGMINSIGLQNAGIDALLDDLDAYHDGDVPVVASVAGDTVEEFAGLCARLSGEGRIDAVELNLSCPNVEHGGLTFCAGPGAVSEVVGACRAALKEKPLLAKLTNEGVLANALAAEDAGADALTLINTVPALAVDPHERTLLRGGLSGPAIKPIALRAVHEVSGAVGVPVIGCGGVARGTDVAEFMLAGATAVQIGSGSFARDPRAVLEEFSAYLRETGLAATTLTRGI